MLTMDYTLVGKFPAPLEVDRELYGVPEENIPKRVLKFPAPLEVGR